MLQQEPLPLGALQHDLKQETLGALGRLKKENIGAALGLQQQHWNILGHFKHGHLALTFSQV